ncbi:hypothetical protein [Paraherbaspirillum soli]|uniref:Uncharacterized protein n=1 Tax=Paraherbaspirillum soli TaxID=631222 RepID=A0ABW0M971_9BURK
MDWIDQVGQFYSCEAFAAASLNRLDRMICGGRQGGDFSASYSGMDDHPHYTNNHNVILLMSKQPVLDWIVRVDPAPSNLSLKTFARSKAYKCRVNKLPKSAPETAMSGALSVPIA